MPSCGQLTSKVTNLLFFTSNDRFCALDLKSEKWLIIRDKGVEVVCPMITEKYTRNQQSTQTAMQTPQIDKQITNARWPPTMNSILPAGCSQSQLPPQHKTRPWPYADLPLHFTARCLPSTIPGPGLNLGFCNFSTGAQSSYLLTRLLPSTRRVVLPGGTEIPNEPPDVMLRARISELTERASPPQYCKRKNRVCLFLAR